MLYWYFVFNVGVKGGERISTCEVAVGFRGSVSGKIVLILHETCAKMSFEID